MQVDLAQAIEKLIEPGDVISKAELISFFHDGFPNIKKFTIEPRPLSSTPQNLSSPGLLGQSLFDEPARDAEASPSPLRDLLPGGRVEVG
jgi:hypothetical protein